MLILVEMLVKMITRTCCFCSLPSLLCLPSFISFNYLNATYLNLICTVTSRWPEVLASGELQPAAVQPKAITSLSSPHRQQRRHLSTVVMAVDRSVRQAGRAGANLGATHSRSFSDRVFRRRLHLFHRFLRHCHAAHRRPPIVHPPLT